MRILGESDARRRPVNCFFQWNRLFIVLFQLHPQGGVEEEAVDLLLAPRENAGSFRLFSTFYVIFSVKSMIFFMILLIISNILSSLFFETIYVLFYCKSLKKDLRKCCSFFISFPRYDRVNLRKRLKLNENKIICTSA